MTITDQVVKNIIAKVVKSQDHRVDLLNILNADFLQFAIDFFKKVAFAKLNSEEITIGWYKKAFMDEDLPSNDIAINSGLNTKTIGNMFKTTKRTVVIEAANEHFETLYDSIQALVDLEKEIDLTLTIKMKGVSVDLNVSESLIVINTLAVKRAALSGGLWSTMGKRVEKYLMLTLCNLYKVPQDHYDALRFVKDKDKKVDREVDFYLLNDGERYRCEIKLMGKGNPESADAIFARHPHIFVADTLSQQNKNQAEELNVYWVALCEKDGYKRFNLMLEKFGIPHTVYNGDLNVDLPEILDGLFRHDDNDGDLLITSN